MVPNTNTDHPDSEEGWCEAERAFLHEDCVRHAQGSKQLTKSLPNTTDGVW